MRKFAIGTLLAALGLLVAGVASAATIGFQPGSQALDVGDPWSVDVVVSDLGGEIVSAYDLDILFDPSVININVVSFSGALGNIAAAEAFIDVDILGPGVLDVASLSLLSDPALLALQGGDSVTLFTLSGQALAEGTTNLSFVFDNFNDVKGSGANVLQIEPEEGTIRVGEEPAIPEPSAALVFAAGAAVLATALRRRRA